MIEVLDKIKAIEAERFPNHEMFGRLAACMVLRDGLVNQRQLISQEREEYGQPLLDLDLEILEDQDKTQLGVSALGLYVCNRKLATVKKAISDIDLFSQFVSTYPIVGSRAKVEAADDGRYSIGTSRINKYGQQDGLSQWHKSKVGKVKALNLSPVSGGWIELEGRFGKTYSAGPLIDRHRDYTLAFTVTPH